MADSAASETLGFQTEVRQLLRLMIHSLYSNREIFLRELISNASDAADKLRFAALADASLLADDPELKVELSVDSATRTLTISDNGIGMSRDEVIANLGTIARSGTADFINQLSGDDQADANLIGQFGVGFYSAFIVADSVVVTTRRAGDPDSAATQWVSAGDGEFTVSPAEAPRGTRIVLQLKDDADEYLDSHRLRALVKRYSDHIAFPVVMRSSVTDGDDDDAAQADAAETVETLNSATALWTRSRSDVNDDEYTEFYKHLTHDFADPLIHSHNRVEGKREYTSLLYVPASAPFDMWNREAPRGLKLYVQRVFIMDDAEQFLPLYLRFVRGVVDASDLPLNVSRELLQASPDVDAMKSALTRRVLDMLAKLAKDDAEKYQAFWNEFGEVVKEGLAEDPANRERIAKLLRFASTAESNDDASVAFADYIERASEGQDQIYYLTAESLAVARRSPYLEVFGERGIEVLLMTGRLDEWVIGHLPEFDGKKLTDISRADVTLPGESADKPDLDGDDDGEHKGVMKKLRQLLKDDVEKIRISRRLVSSPAVLVIGEHALSAQMRRLLEAAGQSAPASKPELEINPDHGLCQQLAEEPDEQRFEDLAYVLLDQARLSAGESLPDPAAYVERVQRLLLPNEATA
ncbi:MAG: molecular chaperone HtpG [Pseudomonadota bacterium]